MAKSPKRKDYLKDYKRGEDGKFSYGGKTYGFKGSEQERKKTYLNLVLLALLLLASVVTSGLSDARCAIGSFYVILPLIGEVCAYFAFAWYLSKLLMEGKEIRGYIFETANNRIPPACLILMFFSILGICTSALYLVFNGFNDELVKSLLYLGLKALNAVLAFCIKKYYNTIQWSIL